MTLKQIGRYRIGPLLGRGMAEVYRAYDTKERWEVALKILPEDIAENEEMVERFRREAKAAGALEHPNIIQIIASGYEDKHHYMVMPYIAMGTLAKWLKEKGALEPKEAVDLLAPIAEALEQAHMKDLIHRDIKPANILIRQNGKQKVPILTDFGIAHIAELPALTIPRTILGTAYYMSPEQAKGQKVQRQADIYSLGVVLYQAVTGRLPFNGRDLKKIRDDHIHKTPAAPRSIKPDIPPAIEAVILKALAKKPEERFESAAEMGDAMRDGLLGKMPEHYLPPVPKEPNPSPNSPPGLLVKLWNFLTRILPAPTKSTDFFICYNHDASNEEPLSRYLYEYLADRGYQLFLYDYGGQTAQLPEKIDQQLQASKLLVVLLPQEASHSQLMQAIVRRTYDYRKLQEWPRILPVLMGSERGLPSAIYNFLDPRQYVVWQSSADNQRVGNELLLAIQSQLPSRTPLIESPSSKGHTSMIGATEPLPEVDPKSILRELEAPGGVDFSQFYVERQADEDLKQQLTKVGKGTLTTIRAARQTGKTSLLVQGIFHARQNGTKVINIDMQRIDRSYLETPARFLRYLAEYIVLELGLDLEQVEQEWNGGLGPQDKLTRLLSRYILPQIDEAGLLLAMDEVDRLLETNFHTDFFALVRSWHNSRAYQEQWRKLHLVLVISTEPSLLIADDKQSPFNVGLKLYLQDFTTEQVADLNQRYGNILKHREIAQLMKLLNGHPYLTRQALYILVKQSLSWAQLERNALTNESPFAEHLRRYHRLLRDKEELKAGLREVMNHNRCTDGMTRYRLLRAGLVKGDSERCVFRCDLYRKYFEDKL